jgi:hypothetical protein
VLLFRDNSEHPATDPARSIEQDKARIVRAERRQAQLAFLWQATAYVLAVPIGIAGVIAVLSNPSLWPLTVFGGGGLVGAGCIYHVRRASQAEQADDPG